MADHASSRKAVSVDTSVYPNQRDCNRWAVIIGISKYQDSTLNLQYADRDAEKLYQLLLADNGGHFETEYICKLTNKEATKDNITRALRSFLKKPAREDLVIIYFACHGSPDPDRPSNVYFLTYDTDPSDIAGTALPMGDVDRALKDTLLSEKVIILADACHSAAIGSGLRSRDITGNTTLINRYLQEISVARGGTALLTSAETNEVSFEDKKWGGGHGVFTYYLLQGLQGKADVDNNGFITVGELFEYVRENVKQATNHRQHPSIGTNPFDRNLPLAIAHPQKEPSNQPALAGGMLFVGGTTSTKTTSKMRYAALALAALLIGGIGFGAVRIGILSRPGTNSSDPSLPPAVIDKSEQQLKTARTFEAEAINLMSQETLTEESLKSAVKVWQAAIDTLQKIEPENTAYSEAEKMLAAYQQQQRYCEALSLGLIASQLSSTRDSNTAEEWVHIIELWDRAITLLKAIPAIHISLYQQARSKILLYQENRSIANEFRLGATFYQAVRIANKANAAGAQAVSSNDWLNIAALWGQASEGMQAVTTEDEARYATAQKKKTEYTDYQEYARNRADLLTQREQNSTSAKQFP